MRVGFFFFLITEGFGIRRWYNKNCTHVLSLKKQDKERVVVFTPTYSVQSYIPGVVLNIY